MPFTNVEQARKDSRFYAVLSLLCILLSVIIALAIVAACILCFIYEATLQAILGIALLMAAMGAMYVLERFLYKRLLHMQSYISGVEAAMNVETDRN